MMEAEQANILQEADRLTSGDRHEDYGDALEDATRWARIASAATGLELKPEHLPAIMVALKMSRAMYRWKRDNWVDIAGYARVAEMIHDAQMQLYLGGDADVDRADTADS